MLRLPGPLLYNKGGPILFLVRHVQPYQGHLVGLLLKAVVAAHDSHCCHCLAGCVRMLTSLLPPSS